MRRERGFSLVEALVAMGVMAFGMLAVVAVQSTLRLNSDIAKQRSTAVRLAQEAMEEARAFAKLSSGGGVPAYDDLATGTATDPAVTPFGSNASFTLTRTIADLPAPLAGKLVTVDVAWKDRTDTDQSVRLTSVIAGLSPELAGSLSIPAFGTPTRLRSGRNAAIPVTATDLGDGTSSFAPPGTSGLQWIFSNESGVILRICNPTCVIAPHQLLSGFVRFAITSIIPPTDAMAETPPPPTAAVSVLLGTMGVEVSSTTGAPIGGPATTVCYEAVSSAWLVYYCAIPVDNVSLAWSGRSSLTGIMLSSSIADATAAVYRVCRYTPQRDHVGDPPLKNSEHPLDYTGVKAPLVNQNFLVIAGGNDTLAFDCPSDDSSTPFVNGNTFHHQPPT